MNIKLLITNWVLIMCPVVLEADKEVSPAVSGLCLVRSGEIIFGRLTLALGFECQFLQV